VKVRAFLWVALELTNFLRLLAKNDGGILDGALRSSSSALSGRRFAKRPPVGAETARSLPMNLCHRPRCSYFDKDSISVVGKGVAVLQGGRVALGGVFAWMAWAAVHLEFLAQSSLRVSVFVQWVWTYLAGRRGAGLIVNHHGSVTDTHVRGSSENQSVRT
jgi:hypothetical protein